MRSEIESRLNSAFEGLAVLAARWSSRSSGFAFALGLVLIWLAAGPFLHYSAGWQLVITTSTTIITFLMVFLIQRSQSKDALAMQMKLDEIVAALQGASNSLLAAEELSEEELGRLRQRFLALAAHAERLDDKHASLSHEAVAPTAEPPNPAPPPNQP
jgi:low affinity Fe/Cu permease